MRDELEQEASKHGLRVFAFKCNGRLMFFVRNQKGRLLFDGESIYRRELEAFLEERKAKAQDVGASGLSET